MPKKKAVPADPLPHWNTLSTLDRKAMAEVWLRAFGSPIPRKLFKPVVVRLLGYRLQELQFGGLSPTAERYLAGLLPKADGAPRRPPPRQVKAGTRLLRTWQGRIHTVTVTDAGFLYQGETHRSLSVIARKITGTSWSGPAFFGLTKAAEPKRAKA